MQCSAKISATGGTVDFYHSRGGAFLPSLQDPFVYVVFGAPIPHPRKRHPRTPPHAVSVVMMGPWGLGVGLTRDTDWTYYVNRSSTGSFQKSQAFIHRLQMAGLLLEREPHKMTKVTPL